MTKELITDPIERALISGDLADLKPAERAQYYNSVCESLGLNALTNPFQYIVLNNKLTLYATRGATDQLRSKRGVSIQIVSRERLEGDLYVVTARATLPDGRCDESTAAVSLMGRKKDFKTGQYVEAKMVGDELSNCLMKCETKAKRRVTLSICGLGMLDESEVETIPGAKAFVEPQPRLGQSLSNGGTWPVVKDADEAVKRIEELKKQGEMKDNLLAETLAAWGDSIHHVPPEKPWRYVLQGKEIKGKKIGPAGKKLFEIQDADLERLLLPKNADKITDHDRIAIKAALADPDGKMDQGIEFIEAEEQKRMESLAADEIPDFSEGSSD